MRVVIDYRPALRDRTGVGEYVYQLARALRQVFPDDSLTLFTSSLKDRPETNLADAVPGARVSDHRIPNRALNLAWHRLEWPPVEWCVGEPFDIAFSPHPLLLPSRRAAQVVMVHDVDFMVHPERTQREIRRDYPRLAGPHARRANRVIVPSRHTAQAVSRTFDVPPESIAVCPPGVPEWTSAARGFSPNGYLLTMGTAEPRKNVGALIAAYRALVESGADVPSLVLVGKPGPDTAACLESISVPPLAGRVWHLGYVPDYDRQRVYAGARAFVLPSLDEGFGMPVLEAMSLGIPVIASARGALPDLVGEAGLLIDPEDPRAMVEALTRVLGDYDLAQTMARRGMERAHSYAWSRTATLVHQAFEEALHCRDVSRSDARSRTDRQRAPGRATTQSTGPRVPGVTVPHPRP